MITKPMKAEVSVSDSDSGGRRISGGMGLEVRNHLGMSVLAMHVHLTGDQ
jgi:hypothetical protein